jgi:hypothetical protein
MVFQIQPLENLVLILYSWTKSRNQIKNQKTIPVA